MNEHVKRISRPRCFLLYAIAPDEMPASEANRILNAFIGDPALPLAIFHDHFIGQPGGLVIFYVETTQQRDELLAQTYLEGWHVEIQPLIFSHSPSAFDEQIAFTLRAYRGVNWEMLQKEQRPSFGNPSREAETAEEE
ncbi:MAG TPA: hypothetical protein VFY66_11195 [Anaerolineales bacterium]|nr:hypothetical protein [Anaerolineales bacterium]